MKQKKSTTKTKSSNKSNFIYKNFTTALKDLKKIKTYFWFSLILFLAVTFLSFLFPVFFEKEIMNLIKELVLKTQGMNVFELIQFIMANNMQSSFLAILLGIFLGIFPLTALVINAYVLGFVASKTVALEGFLVLWRLLPHGIFEIPAILISIALGLRIGILLMYECISSKIKKINNLEIGVLIFLSILFLPIAFLIYIIYTFVNKPLRKKFIENLLYSIRIFIFIVIPLLVIAGIIEGVLIVFLG